MADALLSPAVGATMWAASGAALAYSARQVRLRADDHIAPLMGVLGAFVFAAQMINFSIPATGSSGHLGGGLLLSVLLGPYAALLVIASILTVQALFFADGGLLALGANIFNLGVVPCFIAYPLVYRTAVGAAPPSRFRIIAACLAAAVAGLLLGALGVGVQTVASGITSLPFEAFMLLMLPIHLAIGVVEGLATAALLLFIQRMRPELLSGSASAGTPSTTARRLIASLAVATVLAGGVMSWFASTQPDGLEWSIERAAPGGLPASQQGPHRWLADLQQGLSFLPDYGFPRPAHAATSESEPSWPAVEAGTSMAGIAGGVITLAIVWLIARLLRRRRRG